MKPTCACIECKTTIIKSIVVGIRRTATSIESTAAGIKGIVQCTQASIQPLTSKGDAEEQPQSIVAGMQALSALPPAPREGHEPPESCGGNRSKSISCYDTMVYDVLHITSTSIKEYMEMDT